MFHLSRLLLYLTSLSLPLLLVYYTYQLYTQSSAPHLLAWFSAGAFVLATLPISLKGIYGHLAHYNNPRLQSCVVRILWMVPLYSITSWLCLRFKVRKHVGIASNCSTTANPPFRSSQGQALWIETLRDCYESYVIYNFLDFLTAVLGGPGRLQAALKDKSPTRGFHPWPFNWCFSPWTMGQPKTRQYHPAGPSFSSPSHQHTNDDGNWESPFYLNCRFGVLQYVLLKILLSLVACLLQMNGLYTEGDFSPR